MKFVRYTLGALFAVGTLVLSVYVGLFVMFIGGINDIIDGAKADPTDDKMVTWGIVKVLLGSTVSEAIAVGCFMLAMLLIFGSESLKRRRKLKKSRA